MAARLIPASPVERSAAVRAFVLLATADAALAAMVWAHDLLLPPLALAVAAAGHRFSLRHVDRPRRRVHVAVGLAVAACFAAFAADSVLAVFGGQLPQLHLTLLMVAATSFVLRTRRNLYSSLWMTLAALYLVAVYAWDSLFALPAVGWLACLAGLWTAAHLARLGVRGLRLPAWPLAVSSGGALLLTAAAFALLPQPDTRPIVASFPLPSVGFRGELEQPALSLVQVTGGRPGLDLRYRGRLSGDVVLLVRTGVPAYWRGQVFDRYQAGVWSASRPELRTLPGTVGPAQLGPPPGPQRGVFTQVYQVVRPLPGAIPVAAPLRQLSYPAVDLRRDRFGTLLAPGGLRPGTAYTAVSYLPDLDAGRLRASAAGPAGAEDLDATGLSARARALAERVTAGRGGPYDRAVALTNHLRSAYRYTLSLGRVPPGQDPVDRFLFQDRAGYCEQFAAAEVLMLRGLGIPARLVTGYAPGEFSPLLRQAVVRERDAHAWVEVSIAGHGWVPLDPSPGYPLLAAASPAGRWAPPSLVAALPRLSLGVLAGVPGLPSPALAALAAAGFVAALVVLAAGRRRGRPLRPTEAPELLAVYERLQRRLDRRRALPETPDEYRRAAAGGELDEVLGDVTEAVDRAVYAGRWPSAAELADLRRRVG